MRTLVVAGFTLVLAMQVVFIATAGDRPFPYLPVQILSAAGTAILLFGAATATPLGFAIGLGVNAVGRVAQIMLGLSRLPLLLNLALAAGWIWATVAASRRTSLAPALWFLAFVHAASMFFALGRFGAAIGLALGAAGLFLAAPAIEKR